MSNFPINPLRITFHTGSCRELSRVAATAKKDGVTVVMTEVTPFHPRNYRWPDQPADKGRLQTADGARFDVEDAVFVGVSPDGIFFVDGEIPAKKHDEGWRFCVGHAVRAAKLSFARGEEITLLVDEDYRRSLSRAHSAAHLMALALNRSMEPLWRKDAVTDSFGAPDFDTLAMDVSIISPLACRDRYRLGKSLRKKGFSADALRNDPQKYENEINSALAAWLREDAPVTQRAEGDGLTSNRYFCTTLEGRSIEMPCGGTHVRALREIGQISARVSLPDEETLIIDTSVS